MIDLAIPGHQLLLDLQRAAHRVLVGAAISCDAADLTIAIHELDRVTAELKRAYPFPPSPPKPRKPTPFKAAA